MMYRTEHFTYLWFHPDIFDTPFLYQWWLSMKEDKAYRYAFPGNSGWDTFEDFCQELSTCNCLMAFFDNTLVAFAFFYEIPHALAFSFFIYPAYRLYLEELCRGMENVVKQVYGEVVLMGFIWKRHRASLQVAKRFGYSICGEVKNLFSKGYDAIIVAKEV